MAIAYQGVFGSIEPIGYTPGVSDKAKGECGPPLEGIDFAPAFGGQFDVDCGIPLTFNEAHCNPTYRPCKWIEPPEFPFPGVAPSTKSGDNTLDINPLFDDNATELINCAGALIAGAPRPIGATVSGGHGGAVQPPDTDWQYSPLLQAMTYALCVMGAQPEDGGMAGLADCMNDSLMWPGKLKVGWGWRLDNSGKPDGMAWANVGERGKIVINAASVATKRLFGMWRYGDKSVRKCACIQMAGTILHEVAHTCGVAHPETATGCDPIGAAKGVAIYAAYQQYPAALHNACCGASVNWSGDLPWPRLGSNSTLMYMPPTCWHGELTMQLAPMSPL